MNNEDTKITWLEESTYKQPAISHTLIDKTYRNFNVEQRPEYTGECKDNILILVKRPPNSNSWLPSDDPELLNNMLKAVSLDPERSIAFADITEKNDVTYLNFKNHIQPDKILCFGLEPKDLLLNLPEEKYKIFKLGSTSILFSDSLPVLHQNVNLKGKLWKLLQVLFKNEN